MVTIATLQQILKDFYLGPIIEALNNQIEMVQLFEKSVLDWSGRQVVIPIHVGRNNGVAYANESNQNPGAPGLGDTLPTAGFQTHVNLNVTARYLYGRFSLSGPAIATAKTTANSFATYVQSEMDGLVTDVKVTANQNMFTGGGAVGFVFERTAVAAGTATKRLAFSGDMSYMLALQTEARTAGGRYFVEAGGTPAQLALKFTLLDDYSTAGPALPVVGGNTFVLAQGLTEDGVLDIHTGAGAGSAIPLNNLDVNACALVEVVGCGRYVAPNFQNGAAGLSSTDWFATRIAPESQGLYANLGTQTHFGNDRSAAANAPLRSTIQCVSSATAVAPQASGLDFGRMQNMLDEIMILGGEDPDCIYVHPGMRQEYASRLTVTATSGTTQTSTITRNALDKPGTADVGYSGYAFNGIPFKMSRHCGKGLMAFLKLKTWTITELQSFGMADLDGNVLSRVAGRDEFEGFVRWYYNLVCKAPNRNAILCGIDFPGRVAV